MTQTIGVVSGLVMKVVSAATGTLARQLNASSAATATCANGTMIPMIMPRATPRGTDRRVKRHSSGARIRFAKGERKRFARKLSCVGMKGSRVQAVVQEMQGEKIYILPWSQDTATFVVHTPQPAPVTRATHDT